MVHRRGMLVIVSRTIALALLHVPIKQFNRGSPSCFYISYSILLIVYTTLMFSESVRRRAPANLICLTILILAIGFMTMMITAVCDVQLVLMALGITTGCCAGIIIFSSQTKYNLPSYIDVVGILGLVLFFFGTVAIIIHVTTGIKWLYFIYAESVALLFMAYLAIDAQMAVGGKKYEIGPEDCIFASIHVFLDITYIFWMLMSLISGSSH